MMAIKALRTEFRPFPGPKQYSMVRIRKMEYTILGNVPGVEFPDYV